MFYVNAPLPFCGQKRYCVKKFIEILDNYPSDAVYLDLFGGSGLLSHNVKEKYPNSRVIFNDYDNYLKRLELIPITNEILKNIQFLIRKSNNQLQMDLEEKNQIIEIIENFIKEYGVEKIDFETISTKLLFCSKIAYNIEELRKKKFYNRPWKTLKFYKKGTFLHNVEVIRGDVEITDFRKVYEKYSNISNLVLILDPPYLQTDNSRYNKSMWRAKEFIDVVKLMVKKRFIFFSSQKSDAEVFLDFLHEQSVFPAFYKHKYSYAINNASKSKLRNDDIIFYNYKL